MRLDNEPDDIFTAHTKCSFVAGQFHPAENLARSGGVIVALGFCQNTGAVLPGSNDNANAGRAWSWGGLWLAA